MEEIINGKIKYKGVLVSARFWHCKPQSKTQILEELARLKSMPYSDFNKRKILACEKSLIYFRSSRKIGQKIKTSPDLHDPYLKPNDECVIVKNYLDGWPKDKRWIVVKRIGDGVESPINVKDIILQ